MAEDDGKDDDSSSLEEMIRVMREDINRIMEERSVSRHRIAEEQTKRDPRNDNEDEEDYERQHFEAIQNLPSFIVARKEAEAEKVRAKIEKEHQTYK